MADITLEQVYALAQQLDPAQRLLLAMRLESSVPQTERELALRKAFAHEHQQLKRAGAFDPTESLYGKFATPQSAWEADELGDFLHAVGTGFVLFSAPRINSARVMEQTSRSAGDSALIRRIICSLRRFR